MKKVLSYVFFSILLFSSFVVPIHATETIQRGTIQTPDKAGVHVRLGPGTSYGKANVGLDDGHFATILGEAATDDGTTGCPSSKWYKIQYATSVGYGYVCSNFIVNIETIEIQDYNYEEELAKFPENFKPYIAQLHTIYPNATFVALYATNKNATQMDFNTAIDNENILGKNLLWDSNGSRDGLKRLDTYSYDRNISDLATKPDDPNYKKVRYRGGFYNEFDGGGINWYAANKETIAYYLDSRNFLNEKNIFMFESLTYNTGHSVSGVESILKGTFMYDTFVDNGVSNKKFSQVILEAGKVSGVGAYFLASRIKQEMGSTRNDLVYGTYVNYPQYNGYYNFFNIGATGDKIQENGLKKAFNEGWNSEEKSILGGSRFIGNDYILKGQNTQYFQKWDIQCTNKNSCFSHQYMQNLEAPYNEGISSYNAYKNTLGNAMYLEPFVFIIPIYQNMPETPSTKPNEASPIPYLNKLMVNGFSANNFSGLNTEYSLIVPAGTTSIAIDATAIAASKGATVRGTGNIALTSDQQDIIVTGVAANGATLDYTIHVTRLQPDQEEMTLAEMGVKILEKVAEIAAQEEAGDYSYSEGLTDIEIMLKLIADVNPNALFIIKDLQGNIATSGIIGTGYTWSLTVGNEAIEDVFSFKGDNDGDGEITIVDLLRVQKYLLKSTNLTDAQYKASDINDDGVVDVLDLLLIQKHLLGEKLIVQ